MLGSTEAAGSVLPEKNNNIYMSHSDLQQLAHATRDDGESECNKRKIPGICYVYICIHKYI